MLNLFKAGNKEITLVEKRQAALTLYKNAEKSLVRFYFEETDLFSENNTSLSIIKKGTMLNLKLKVKDGQP